ncbi:DUF397 domain-containing protein [Streptomyces sp. NBC_01092]|uniref:DUF397 domain-containing protein n=1 Tax=Streptomyces sp. NBC_01092 TaxID=2903748 RepID=UPI0038700B31|nr:DUF397 domain-containing protein [Streptomyces sp. NBC_01092]
MKCSRRVDLTSAVWFKSSYSNEDGADCVEVADNLPGITPVRDSKTPEGPVLAFPRDSWALFIDAVRAS